MKLISMAFIIYCFERWFITLTKNSHQKGLLITCKFIAASSNAENVLEDNIQMDLGAVKMRGE
jgi:hypothetical protein